MLMYPNAVGFFITIAGAAVVAEAFHMNVAVFVTQRINYPCDWRC